MRKDPQAAIVQKQSWEDYFLFVLKSPDIAREARPGQFVMVKVNDQSYPLLRRPLSIHAREADQFEIFFQKSGLGTSILAKKGPQETLDILGPLGQGFRLEPELKGKAVFLVGGGRGIAPLFFLARELVSLGARPKVLYGGKRHQDLCLKEKFELHRHELACSTEDGSAGFKGLVTELLEEEFKHFLPEHIFACGPEAMMIKIAQKAEALKIKAEFSLESIMGCGFGACWGCARPIKRGAEVELLKICEEGPVFPADEIIWQ